MSQKLLNSYQQFSDLNGNPLAGGSLVFSETGTDTPKTVYAAEGQTSSLGSTVTLDSAGRPSSGGSVTEVYSAATGAYRITVKDSAGVNVVVTENVSALLEFSALTMTGQLKLDDSTSTSTPPLGFDGDTDTGLARPAADILALVTGGAERFRATSSLLSSTLPMSLGGEKYQSGSGTFTVAASGTTTEVVEVPQTGGAYLVCCYVQGDDMASNLIGVVINGDQNLVSAVATLVSDTYTNGTIALQTKANASAFTFDASNARAYQWVLTGDGVAPRTATHRYLRIG